MAYIGNTPADKFLTLTKQNFSTSATTSYTLDSSISSTQDIALFINNVRQSPVDAYTVSGTALTLTSATAGTDEMYCVYLGKTVGTVSPASNSVTTAMLQANAVTGAKLNTDVISAQTALGATPADTDELLVSDAGVLKRVDYSYLKDNYFSTTAFSSYLSATQSISDSTETTLTFNTERYDLGSNFNTGDYTYTAPSTGYYLFNFMLTFKGNANSNLNLCNSMLKKNGSANTDFENNFAANPVNKFSHISSVVINATANDTFKINVYIAVATGTAPTVQGTITNSYFEGFRIA